MLFNLMYFYQHKLTFYYKVNIFFFFYRKYELAIRTYKGDDPLAPHFDYIKWLEQIYLKHGPESNILLLLEETVQKFKDNPKYKQDSRFVQILINFVNIFLFYNIAMLYIFIHMRGIQ